ncbi:hypothetical protein HZA33_05030 [Candidatus Pacearchaeota archaeon]|nr:hypothetical protein [Candidatus Pacearchaeota archaeon]
MVREEIVAGIRNALDRGQSMDQAIQSFILAGYTENEVNEAAAEFQRLGVQAIPAIQVITEKERVQKTLQEIKKKEQKGISLGKLLIIILIILVIAAIVIAAIYIYKEKIGPGQFFSDIIEKIKNLFKR